MLINRYTLKEHMTEKKAHSLMVVIQRSLAHKNTTVEYIPIKGRCSERREQVKNFDLDDVIELFEKKVKTNDQRFIRSWESSLKLLKKMRGVV